MSPKDGSISQVAAGVDFVFVPDVAFDKFVVFGKVGYELRSGPFRSALEKDIVNWVVYDRDGLQAADLLAELQASPLVVDVDPAYLCRRELLHLRRTHRGARSFHDGSSNAAGYDQHHPGHQRFPLHRAGAGSARR